MKTPAGFVKNTFLASNPWLWPGASFDLPLVSVDLRLQKAQSLSAECVRARHPVIKYEQTLPDFVVVVLTQPVGNVLAVSSWSRRANKVGPGSRDIARYCADFRQISLPRACFGSQQVKSPGQCRVQADEDSFLIGLQRG